MIPSVQAYPALLGQLADLSWRDGRLLDIFFYLPLPLSFSLQFSFFFLSLSPSFPLYLKFISFVLLSLRFFFFWRCLLFVSFFFYLVFYLLLFRYPGLHVVKFLMSSLAVILPNTTIQNSLAIPMISEFGYGFL